MERWWRGSEFVQLFHHDAYRSMLGSSAVAEAIFFPVSQHPRG
ncbi:MAG: hypothetical protein ACREV2_03730 [Burkholderiales bacterium]